MSEDLGQYLNGTVPDLVSDQPKLVFVGINPGLWTVKTQTHFAHPSNRFYPALFAAGITPRCYDRVGGLSHTDRDELCSRGIALTNLVARATVKASDLHADELRAGAALLTEKLAAWGAPVVAIAGISAYRTAFRAPKATLGRQTETLGGSILWVVPNPSGLNAQVSQAELADWYAKAAHDAHLI
ncbi:MAG: mismatch-specific DNA-glycosylase [Nitriliruptoraceae bacterium]